MSPEFALKLGILLGSLTDFLYRVEDKTIVDGDVDRIKNLAADVTKKFFEAQQSIAKHEKESKN